VPQRAVFVLRESFGHSHSEIAAILGTSEPGSRQLHRRARQRLGDPQPRFKPEPGEWKRLVEGFLVAAAEGDVAGLERLLADDVVYWGDGGGHAPMARRPVAGGARLARFVAKLFPKLAADPAIGGSVELGETEVNGESAVLAWVGDGLYAVLVPEVTVGRITALRAAANPDKLAFAARQAAGARHRTAVRRHSTRRHSTDRSAGPPAT